MKQIDAFKIAFPAWTQHTEPPWTCDKRGLIRCQDGLGPCSPLRPREVVMANARLMARAPALAEALESIRGLIDNLEMDDSEVLERIYEIAKKNLP